MTDSRFPTDEELKRIESFWPGWMHSKNVAPLLDAARARNALALRATELEEQLYRERGEHLDAVGLLEAQLSTLTRLAQNVVDSSGKPGELIHERALAAFLSTTPPPPYQLRELATAVVEAEEAYRRGCTPGALNSDRNNLKAARAYRVDALAAYLGKGA